MLAWRLTISNALRMSRLSACKVIDNPPLGEATDFGSLCFFSLGIPCGSGTTSASENFTSVNWARTGAVPESSVQMASAALWNAGHCSVEIQRTICRRLSASNFTGERDCGCCGRKGMGCLDPIQGLCDRRHIALAGTASWVQPIASTDSPAAMVTRDRIPCRRILPTVTVVPAQSPLPQAIRTTKPRIQCTSNLGHALCTLALSSRIGIIGAELNDFCGCKDCEDFNGITSLV